MAGPEDGSGSGFFPGPTLHVRVHFKMHWNKIEIIRIHKGPNHMTL